jgi:MFS family permease
MTTVGESAKRILDAPCTNNRWTIAIAGSVVMATLGTIYSWSLFTQPLIASFGWTTTATTLIFSFAIFSLGMGAVLGGRWQDSIGPRKVALGGVAMWASGNLLAGLGMAKFGVVWMCATYGVVGGFGVGMAYVAPIAVVMKWFPGARGLGSGMVVMGFGLGACLYNFIVNSIPSFHATAMSAAQYAAAQSVAPETLHTLAHTEAGAVMNVFTFSGIVFGVVAGLAAALLRNPPARSESDERHWEVAYTTREMLATPQFCLLWFMLFLNVAAGILVISNALPLIQELTGLAPALAAALYGGLALFNGGGRLFWGPVSDRIGRNAAFALILGIQAAVFGVLGGVDSVAAIAISCGIVLLCFGGGFATMPAFVADYFGTRHMGANYGVMLTAWGAAGIAGPLFAAHVKDVTGSYSGALTPVAVVLLLSVLLPIVAKKPQRPLRAPRPKIYTPTATGFLGQPAWLTSTGFLERGPDQHWWRE